MKTIEEELQTTFKTDKQKMIVNILYTFNYLRKIHTEWLLPFDISPQQYNILRILNGQEGSLSMQQVKKRMIDNSPNVTRLADKLIDKGLISRDRCTKDRRTVYIQIDQKGKDLLKEVDEQNTNPRNELLSQVTDHEAKVVSDVLDKLRYL